VNTVGQALSWLLQAIWRNYRVLWTCRISVLSSIGGGLFIAATPQTRDLFADLGLSWKWALFFLFAFGWAWIVHWAARHALRMDDWVPDAHVPGGIAPGRRTQLQAEFVNVATAWPRILGTAVFGFIGWALFKARNNFPAAAAFPEAEQARSLELWLFAATVVLGIGFFAFVWFRGRMMNWLHAQSAGYALRFPAAAGPLLTGCEPFLLDIPGVLGLREEPRPSGPRWVNVFILVVALVITILFIWAVVQSAAFAERLPRAVFAPLIVVGGVLLMNEISIFSLRLRAPLLLLVVLVSALLSVWADRYNDVRWISPAVRDGTRRQIPIEKAVDRWKSANHCNAPGQLCPKPILVVGSGGASRAAFMTASVVGAMLDGGIENPGLYGDVRPRIFAISAVSGSSVAAAVIRAALADAGEERTPPCRKDPTDRAWFGSIAGVSPAGPWRDCLEKIVSGDFLSAVMVGLVYQDNFPLVNPVSGRPLLPDRAALLEQGIERRYNKVVQGEADACATAEGAKPSAADRGMCRAFGYHPDPGQANAWLPILFLNATSVGTGRRIIISDVLARSNRHDSVEPLFPLAYDLCDLRGSCDADPGVPADIRLSTASIMSSRFPIISPFGAVRDNEDKKIADRLVDGGYFDDAGLATAADIVATLKGFGLDPVVIQVTNHPTAVEQHQPDPGRLRTDPNPPHTDPNRPPLPPPIEGRSWFDTYTSIATAINATRSGHSDGYERYLEDMLYHKPCRLFRVEVQTVPESASPFCRSGRSGAAGMTEVSISWWMSQPMQSYLDRQLCRKINNDALDQTMRVSALAEAPDAPADPSACRAP
jgi:hypothetical protein